MKENLFFYIIPLHYSQFYNCFLLCCAQSRHFFCNTKCSKKGVRKPFCQGGQNKKRFYRDVFLYYNCFNCKNLVMTKKSHDCTFNQCPKSLFLFEILGKD